MIIELRKVPNKPGYWCSPDGRIFRELHPSPTKAGYPKFGRSQTFVHHAVARCYIGPPPFPRARVLHKDGKPAHNHWKNLYWGTQAENVADAWRHGTMGPGELNGCAKLTEADVREIRVLYAAGGVSYAKLGRWFGVNHTTIYQIVRHKSWRHLS